MSHRVQKQDISGLEKNIIKTAWNTKEDNLLKKGIRICGMNWIAIAQYVPNRNPNQCAQRWKRLQGHRQNQLILETRGRLIAIIADFIIWIIVIEDSLDCLKQKQNRFINALDPQLKQHSFTQEEDQLIYEEYLEYGPKWSYISKIIEEIGQLNKEQILQQHKELVPLSLKPILFKINIESAKRITRLSKRRASKKLWNLLKVRKNG